MFFLVSCFGRVERLKVIAPLSMVATNPRIERPDPNTPDFYEWNADVIFANNSIDTIYVDRGTGDLGFISFHIKYYIVIDKNVYIGTGGDYVSNYSNIYKIAPGESVPSIFFFLLKKDYAEMDDLYISITTSYSSAFPVHESLVGFNPFSVMMKNVLYEPTNKFHVNNKLNRIDEIDINIDSLMGIKGYNQKNGNL